MLCDSIRRIAIGKRLNFCASVCVKICAIHGVFHYWKNCGVIEFKNKCILLVNFTTWGTLCNAEKGGAKHPPLEKISNKI